MKKLLLATVGLVALGVAAPASAADMPVKAAPPPPVAPIYNWTGFYIGAHVGGAWTDTDWFYPCSATNLLIPSPCNLAQGGHSASSWLAGGQVGFNYQVGRFVWGIEADFSATRMEGRNLDVAFPTQEFLHSRTDFIGTVAPRVGVAWDRVLLYAKGGVAWAHDDYWLTLTPNQLLAGQTFATGDATRWAGWSASGSSTHSRKIGPSRPSTTIWILEPSAFSSRAPAWNPHSLISTRTSGEKFKLSKSA